MEIGLIFKIAAVGIIVSVIHQILKHSGREEQAFLTSLAGLILDLYWIIPYIKQLFETINGAEPSWFGFLMTVKEDSGFDRNAFSTYLEENKIQTRNLFAGNLTRHPCFESLEENHDYRIAVPLVNTDTMMNNAVWIGVYPGMEKIHLDYMADTIIKFFEGK